MRFAGPFRPDLRRAALALLGAVLTLQGAVVACSAAASPPPLGLPPGIELPLPAIIGLGRDLFFDRRLSANGTLSCGMCHIPEQGFSQNELMTPVGLQGQSVRRNAPSLYNVAYATALFHDGRESSLEEQIWSPLLAENEMGNPNRNAVLERIRELDGYARRFARLYPAGLTAGTLGNALAGYQRSLLSGDSAFDRWYFGGDPQALPAQATRGFDLFTTLGCAGCHILEPGFALFTDARYHNTGIAYRSRQKRGDSRTLQVGPHLQIPLEVTIATPKVDDDGRQEVTGQIADRWRYRTPSLRNVALTGPYMHDGSLGSLAAVVDYYDAGGSGDPHQDPRVRPLGLSEPDKAALEAFLIALTGSNVAALTAAARSSPIGDHR